MGKKAWGRIVILDNAGLSGLLVYLVSLVYLVYLVYLAYLVSSGMTWGTLLEPFTSLVYWVGQ